MALSAMTSRHWRHGFALLTLLVFLIGSDGKKLEGQLPQFPLQQPQPTQARQPIPLPVPNPEMPAQLTPSDVNAFLDGFLPLQMQRDDVAGAVIEITLDGTPLVQKGYGYANWKKKQPINPASTTFRLASISKTITYVAMMQQVEQGHLNLDDDIARYLDFAIRPGPVGVGNAPITLRQLATHTAGFEEELHDLGSGKDGKLPLSLRSFLIRDQPLRFAKPGTALAYSNYGIALIGYIVQRVSGEDFPAYTQRHIFAPLRMSHSSFQQPLPAGADRSLGYINTQEGDTGFESFEAVPAGGLSSTVTDMTRFGRMLLRGGELDGARVLQPASVALFFTPQFAPAPLVLPWNLGFYPEQRNGYTFTGHGGDLIGFHSEFWVEPTHKLTFIVSYNSQKSSGVARTELLRAFADRYLPGPGPRPALLKSDLKSLRQYEGSYVSSRRADDTKARLFLTGMSHTVKADKAGFLTISGISDLRGAPLHFAPVGHDTFFNREQQSFLHFTRNARGQVDGYVTPSRSDRLPWYFSQRFLRWSANFASLTICLVLLASFARTWRRFFQRRRPPLHPQPGTFWLTWPMQLASWAVLLVLVDLAAIFQHIVRYSSLREIGHLDTWFLVQNVLTSVALFAMVFGLFSGLRHIGRRLRWITRLKFACVLLSFLWFAWFFVEFHFVGSTTRY